RVLEALLKRVGAKPVAREIAAVVLAAWPDLYRPGDAEDAAIARKLLARARRSIKDKQVTRALELLPSGVRAIPASQRQRLLLVGDQKAPLELIRNVPERARRPRGREERPR